MRDIRLAHTAVPDWRAGLGHCVAQLGKLTEEHRLGFLYVADKFAGSLGDIAAVLGEVTRVRDWVGTASIGICATGREYFDEPALAMLVAAADPDEYRLLPSLQHDTRPMKQAHGAWIERQHPALALVHADPRAEAVPAVVRSLGDEIGFVVGGLTASRGGGFPQLAGKVTEGGVSGVLFAGGVAVATGLSQGCSPIGPVRRITDCHDNVIVGIDEQPALEVFKQDIGELLARDLRKVAGYIHAALPVPGSDTGDYLVRNLTGIDPQHGLLAIGAEVEVDDPILFVRRDRGAAEQDLSRMLRQLRARAKARPQAGIYVSCLARGPNLFGPESQELRRIRDELGEFPLVGFFANGEISHNRLYGYTGVLTLFL
ncbi:MAG: FIST C-terminal domain-containing protein [Alphaproteobacteria bacterium]|nr:FIST C-terminal domain-containing protein [Alphaproteobacteria bacterium]